MVRIRHGAKELDNSVFVGTMPVGTDSTTFSEAIVQARGTDEADWAIQREVLHQAVYTMWHAHYLQGKLNTKRHIKRRKAKTKHCLINNCMLHTNLQNSIKKVLLHEFVVEYLNACETKLEAHDGNDT